MNNTTTGMRVVTKVCLFMAVCYGLVNLFPFVASVVLAVLEALLWVGGTWAFFWVVGKGVNSLNPKSDEAGSSDEVGSVEKSPIVEVTTIKGD